MKIDFKCWTWGMEGHVEEVNEVVKILNTKDWSRQEAETITRMFKELEDSMEGLKESAWGEDA